MHHEIRQSSPPETAILFPEEFRFLCLKQDRQFNFLSRASRGKVLFVGEGNFSFSASLAQRSGIFAKNIIASVPTARTALSDTARHNVSTIERNGGRTAYNVDATKLHRRFVNARFATIVFQFPNAGRRTPLFGRNPNHILLRNFLKSSRFVLASNGHVVVSIVDSPHCRAAFNPFEAAGLTGFRKPQIFSFSPSAHPGYSHENTNDADSALKRHNRFNTWVFTKR